MSVRDLMNEIYALNSGWGDGLEWEYFEGSCKINKR
ncbi:MAG: hypothetical protein CM15mP33_09750 [Candidatus Neomarinimicrobiota bacterium]|nr:MAG: hypothetical protein CM15mP33_09750 [Candidatus Neomarinimicrobiota bacterium]